MSDAALSRPRRLAAYRIVTWALLLLACFGVMEYVMHGWQVVHLLTRGNSHRHVLHVMLAWDVAYLLVAGLTVMLTAGVLMRREWARRGLRVLSAALAVWSVVMAVGMISRWLDFRHMAKQLMARPDLSEQMHAHLQHLGYTLAIGAGLECLAVPVLVWLWWRLGRPALRAGFRSRRRLFT